MKKLFQHFQSYSLENPGEVKKMVLGFIFFMGCSFIIYSNSKAGWFIKLFAAFAILMGLFAFFMSFIGLYTLIFTRPKFKKKILPTLLAELNLQGNEQVLDLGSHKGLLPLLLSERLITGKVTTLYPQLKKYKKAFQKVKKKLKRKKLKEKVEATSCDMAKLPYPDDYFDKVCSTLFFHLLSHGEDLLLEEVLRVLKPNAQFIFFDILSAQSIYLNKEMHKALKPESGFSKETLSFEFYLKYSRKEKVALEAKSSTDFPGGRFVFGQNRAIENNVSQAQSQPEDQKTLEEVKPPWVVHPGYGPCDGYWRQPGEYWFYQVWHPYWRSLSEEEQKEYLEKYEVPEDWWSMYFDSEHQKWLDENVAKDSPAGHILRM